MLTTHGEHKQKISLRRRGITIKKNKQNKQEKPVGKAAMGASTVIINDV